MELPGLILLASVPVTFLNAVLVCWGMRQFWRRSHDNDGLTKQERLRPFLRTIGVTVIGIGLSGLLFWVDHDGIEWIAPALLAIAWAANRLRKAQNRLSESGSTWNKVIIGLIAAQMAIVVLLLPLFAEQLK